ncbi:MAG: hypothetical protein ACRDE2_14235 [Chitinophagaceae bacterium]
MQIINMSTDIRPPMNEYTGQRDLSFNNIDSMVEYILEDVMNLGNVIKETNKPYRNLGSQAFQTFSPTLSSDYFNYCDYDVLNGGINSNYIISFKSEFIREINPPPPKA